jgi:cation:H+ antiporter
MIPIEMTMQWPAGIGRIRGWMQAGWQAVECLDPWFSLLLFLAASSLMVWRLGALERKGFEGTVLGTLIMPYASGFSNLIFAFIMGRSGGNGDLVLENCLVNNATNLTLLIGLPALIWQMNIFPEKNGDRFAAGPYKVHRLNRLSLLLTLMAAFFFTGVLWALARDRTVDSSDGLVLVGMFLFWQVLHVFDVLKQNIQRGRRLHWSFVLDFLIVLLCGYLVYKSIDQLVAWIPKTGPGLLAFSNLGWLSGILMVIPNALLAFYYARAKRADIVYSSQIGDGHICIPMCIGLFALFSPIAVPLTLDLGVLLIMAACSAHFLFIAIWGRLPRFMGLLCTCAYGYFIYKGLF